MQRIISMSLIILFPLLTACGEKPVIDQTCEDFGTCDFDEDGWAAVDGDCNDDNPDVFPGAEEHWYDGVDQDCSGTSDYDADEDGLEDEYDCDDFDAGVGEELDWYFDGDADGYGEDGSIIWACDAPNSQWVEVGLDCDDSDSDAFPGAPEVSDDGVDQNCDGVDATSNSPSDDGKK